MGQSMKIVASGHVTGDGWCFYKDLCEPSTLSFSSPYNTKKSKKHERFSGQQDVSQISRLFFGKPLFLVTLFLISLVTPVKKFALNRFAKYAWNITFRVLRWINDIAIVECTHEVQCTESHTCVNPSMAEIASVPLGYVDWRCRFRIVEIFCGGSKNPAQTGDVQGFYMFLCEEISIQWIVWIFIGKNAALHQDWGEFGSVFSYTPLKSDVGSSTKAAWCHWPQWGMPQRVPHTSWGATILLSRERCWDIFG